MRTHNSGGYTKPEYPRSNFGAMKHETARINDSASRNCIRSSEFTKTKLRYAAPNLTDTSFDTPGSCMVTP